MKSTSPCLPDAVQTSLRDGLELNLWAAVAVATAFVSIRGDLERALDHIAFQIRIAHGIVWWGLIPAWFTAGRFVVVLFHLRQAPARGCWGIALMMVGTFVTIQWWQHYAIRIIYEPRRRELESLRAKLVNPEL